MSRRVILAGVLIALGGGGLLLMTWNAFIPSLLFFCTEFPYRKILIVILGGLAAACLLAGREKS